MTISIFLTPQHTNDVELRFRAISTDTMGSRYVPPALRNGGKSAAASASASAIPSSSELLDSDLYSLHDIQHHYWPNQTTNEDARRTLHDSAAFPEKLSYVLLFKGANPRWDSDGIVFTKSSLDLLPREAADDNPTEAAPIERESPTTTSPFAKNAVLEENHEPTKDTHPPVAAYTQTTNMRTHTVRNFKFCGYFKIDKLTFLEPRSKELARMLEQKWSVVDRRGNVRPRQRSTEAWEESMGLRWAVVKFEKDEVVNRETDMPKIERVELHEEDEVEKKGVTEMLRELRLKQDGKVKENAEAKAEDPGEQPTEDQKETAEKT